MTNVIFFDDVCVLCNGTVNLLIKLDKHRKFRYSSLQGKFAESQLEGRYTQSKESIIFLSEGAIYTKSEAIIQILIELDGIYKIIGFILKVFPLVFSNFVYDLIARNRYRLFGKNDSCRIPTNDIKDLFI